MSDTPRTDAILGDIETYSKHGLVHALGHTSRNLKRELTTAQAEVERLKGEAESWEQVFDRTCEHLAEAREQLTKAQKRSDRASIEFLVIWVTTILISWLLAEMR